MESPQQLALDHLKPFGKRMKSNDPVNRSLSDNDIRKLLLDAQAKLDEATTISDLKPVLAALLVAHLRSVPDQDYLGV